MKLFLFLAVFAGLALPAFSESDAQSRKAFRALFDRLSLLSQTSPLPCEERNPGAAPQTVAYRLTTETVADYEDGFMVEFHDAADRIWSTLVAYEGKAGKILGELTVTEVGDHKEYDHRFFGFIIDAFHVIERPDGSVQELAYRKLSSSGSVVYVLKCVL